MDQLAVSLYAMTEDRTEIVAFDTDGDGEADVRTFDTDGDGKADLMELDSNSDGIVDVSRPLE